MGVRKILIMAVVTLVVESIHSYPMQGTVTYESIHNLSVYDNFISQPTCSALSLWPRAPAAASSVVSMEMFRCCHTISMMKKSFWYLNELHKLWIYKWFLHISLSQRSVVFTGVYQWQQTNIGLLYNVFALNTHLSQ